MSGRRDRELCGEVIEGARARAAGTEGESCALSPGHRDHHRSTSVYIEGRRTTLARSKTGEWPSQEPEKRRPRQNAQRARARAGRDG